MSFRTVAALTMLATLGALPVSASEPVPLIPRTALFGNPVKTEGKISPDGKHLSWLAPVNGVLNVWVAPIDKPEAGVAVTDDKIRDILSYAWARDGRHLVYLQDKGGDQNFHVFSVDVVDRKVRDLTPFDGVRATIDDVSRAIKDEIVIGLNKRDPKFLDLYRVHVATGEMKLVAENPGFDSFLLDRSFTPRVAAQSTQAGGQVLLRPAANGKWEKWLEISPADVGASRALGIDAAGTALFALDSTGRNTAALVRYDLKSGAKTVLAEHPKSDVGAIIDDLGTDAPIAYSTEIERVTWKSLDPKIQSDLDFLNAAKIGDWHVDARSDDNRLWVVAADSDTAPAVTYLYDREKKKLTKLFEARPELKGAPLATMQPVTIRSRDGLELVSYLTRPKNQTGPAPLVLVVHGGPWGRDQFGFNATHQWLANRGYAVLSVNFRASTGLGKELINAGEKEWGRKMSDDLLDGVAWAVKEKIADPAKVAISGASYGGYAVLTGMTRDADTYACGVDIVGPSNLLTLANSIPPYWEAIRGRFFRTIGDPATEEGKALLKERSPLFRADRVKAPLLVGQGANDPAVNKAESDEMVAALRAKQIPVTYALYPDEGHGFARAANNLSFNAITELFLAKCLGGRSEPIGTAFTGASIQVPAGAELIDGLPAALTKH